MQVNTRIDNIKTSALLRRKWRESGLTQTALARETKVTQGQLSRVLAGQFQRPGGTITQLCAHFRVKPIYRRESVSLSKYPALARSLAAIMDGTRRREFAVARLLKGARSLIG